MWNNRELNFAGEILRGGLTLLQHVSLANAVLCIIFPDLLVHGRAYLQNQFLSESHSSDISPVNWDEYETQGGDEILHDSSINLEEHFFLARNWKSWRMLRPGLQSRECKYGPGRSILRERSGPQYAGLALSSTGCVVLEKSLISLWISPGSGLQDLKEIFSSNSQRS